jgi:type VII secretion protein EccB
VQTQRDHVHAHTFMMGRLSSALVEGDPTTAKIPGQRALTGLLIGIILVVLVGGGFAVYGWIVPGGSKAFKQKGAILVEKESGIRYVYLDGVLYPTPNLTSAMLIQGDAAAVKLISRNSLKDIPRGPEIGILDAPQAIPASNAMVVGPWLVCLPGSVVDSPGQKLGVNLDPTVASEPLVNGRFEIVRSQSGGTYLLTGSTRYPIEDDSVLIALGAANARVTLAPQAWLDWVPTGVKLGAARIPGAGDSGPEIDGRSYSVGTLFRQRPASGDEQLFVLRKDGLAPLSRTEFLFADAKTKGAPVDLDAGAVVDAPRSDDRSLTNRLPDLAGLRWQDPGTKVICVRQRPSGEKTFSSEVVLTEQATSGVDAAGKVTVLAKPASGMVVTPVPGDRFKPEVSLLSDSGIAYRMGETDSVAALKLNAAPVVPFPQNLLATLPQGPVLSRAAVTGLARG